MNVVDSLVVTLGLDNTPLKQGASEATSTTAKLAVDMANAATKGEKAQSEAATGIVKALQWISLVTGKTTEASVKASAQVAAAHKNTANSVEGLIRSVGALYLMMAGATSVKNFVSDMIGLDAAVGRLAHNTGSTAEAISGIGRAAERIGGTFDGATGGVRSFVDSFEALRTTGQSSIMEPLARLQALGGKPISLGKNWHQSLMQISADLQTLDRKDPALADYLGRQVVGDQGLVNLLKKGPESFQREESSSKVTAAEAAAAQDLQAKLIGLKQDFQDVGNSILMDFGPAMVSGLRWVKDLVDANKGLIEQKVREWVKDVTDWFQNHKAEVDAFASAIGIVASEAAKIATAFASQSPMMQAFEAFAFLMGGRVLSAVNGVLFAMQALGTTTAPAWALRALGLGSAVAGAGAAAILGGGALAGGMKAPMVDDYGRVTGNWGGDPEHPYGQDPDKPGTPTTVNFSSMWGWLKGKMGFGDDPKVKDDISDTAKATGEIRNLLKDQKNAAGGDAAGGGLSIGGGSGGGGGASLGDRLSHGKHGLGGGGWKGNYGQKDWWNADRQSHAIDYLMKNAGLTETGAKALVARWKYVESSGGPTAVNPGSGAEGIAQWLGSRKGGGSAGSFDEQLGKVATELATTEAKAKRLLNTPGAEARGASGFERAEGWNARTSTDNFTGRVQEGMRHITHNGKSDVGDVATLASSGPAQPTVNEADAFAAHQRLANGGKDPKDRALYDLYVKQQNTPRSAAASPPPAPAAAPAPAPAPTPKPTAHKKRPDTYVEKGAAPNFYSVATPDGGEMTTTDHRDMRFAAPPPPLMVRKTNAPEAQTAVTAAQKAATAAQSSAKDAQGAVTKATSQHVRNLELVLAAKQHRLPGHFHDFAAALQKAKSEAGIRRAEDEGRRSVHSMQHHHADAAHYDRMIAMAGAGRYGSNITHTVDQSSDTRINGGIHIHTRAANAHEIASDIEPHLRRGQAAGRADYGLA